MQFFNKHTIASLLFILIINSHFILTNAKINRKKKKFSSGDDNLCPEENSDINYLKFFITAMMRAKNSFSAQVVQIIEKTVSADKFTNTCINKITGEFCKNVGFLLRDKQDYMVKLRNPINTILSQSQNVLLDESQKQKILEVAKERIPRKTCKILKESIDTNNSNSSKNVKDMWYKLEFLDTLISKESQRIPNQPNFINRKQIIDFLEDCPVIGFFNGGFELQKELLDDIKSRKIRIPNHPFIDLNPEENHFGLLVFMKNEYLNAINNISLKIENGEKILNFDCDILPDNQYENDSCIKANAILYFKALWMLISNMRQNGVLDNCFGNMAAAISLNQIFLKFFNQASSLFTSIFGFLVLTGVKALWNLGVLLFYLYKANLVIDDVDLKSEYLGESAGAAIRLIIDIVNPTFKRKLHRHKK